jgi:hypothetical protein
MQIKRDENGKSIWKSGWYQIGNKRYYFRSGWERKYAYFLYWLAYNHKIKDWYYEPDTFWFEKIRRGTRSYKPDFKIIHLDDSVEYAEVKGFMDAASATKLKRMKIYHPSVKIRVVDKSWFDENGKAMKQLFPEW